MKKLYPAIIRYLDDSFTALWQNRKKVLKYLLIVIPSAIYLGMISFVGKSSEASLFLNTLQGITFFCAGVFHLFLLGKKISFHRLRYFGEGILFTFFVGAVICLTLLFFYLFTDNSMAGVAVVSSILFVLPHACFHVWALYKNIPPRQYPMWTSPLNTKDVNEVLMPEIVNCRFLLLPRKGDTLEKMYFKTVPGDWKLGRSFFTMLNDEQTGKQPQIESTDESGNLYGWEFHRILFKGLIKRRLEPEESVTDNLVTEKSIVYVTRVTVKSDETPVIHKIQYKTILNAEKTIRTTPKKRTIKLYKNHS